MATALSSQSSRTEENAFSNIKGLFLDTGCTMEVRSTAWLTNIQAT